MYQRAMICKGCKHLEIKYEEGEVKISCKKGIVPSQWKHIGYNIMFCPWKEVNHEIRGG